MKLFRLNEVPFKIRSDETLHRRDIVVGFTASILIDNAKSITVQDFVSRILSKVTASECDIYFDRVLRPVGFVSWATRSDLVSTQATEGVGPNHSAQPPHARLSLQIVDFLFRHGDIRSMLRGVRQHLLSKEQPVCYDRHKAGRHRQVRITTRPGIRSVPAYASEDIADTEPWRARPDILENCEDRFAQYAALGQGLIALSQSSVYQDSPLKSAMSLLNTANGMRQMRIYRNAAGEVTGLLTWAWLSQWTMDRLAANGQFPMHPCEWNEGPTLCFRDIAASSESAPQIAADLGAGLFPEETSCAVLVRDRVSKEVVLFSIAELQRDSLGAWVLSQFKQQRSSRLHSRSNNVPSGAPLK